jgi:fatty-acyl-CoA synthase
MRCAPNETGEALGKILNDPGQPGNRFEGYTSEQDSEKKILRNVFEAGDAWFRTGDLLRQDEKGYFYFVDRIGDTYRWKGENVSTEQVAAAIAAYPGIRHANVYGVAVPGCEGRAGMAALVTSEDLDLAAFRTYLVERLPAYAQPTFLRIGSQLEVTGTFKYTKTAFVRDGYNPAGTADLIYCNHPERRAFVHLDQELFCLIQSGKVRL